MSREPISRGTAIAPRNGCFGPVRRRDPHCVSPPPTSLTPRTAMSKLLASIVTPLAACLAFVGASTWSPAQTVPKYSAEYLGESLGATTLSHSGQLIGNATIGGNTRGWVASSGSPLVPLPLPPGFISSNANDINAARGDRWARRPLLFAGVQEQAVAWFPNRAGGYTIQMLGSSGTHREQRRRAQQRRRYRWVFDRWHISASRLVHGARWNPRPESDGSLRSPIDQ